MRPLLKILAVNIGIFTGGIILIELIFGNWLKPNYLNQLNILRGVSFEKDISHLYESDRPVMVYTRDQYGLRGNYEDVSAIDILTIGGSTTDQRSISDDDTWQEVLRKNFKDHGKQVSIVNAGVDGQSTYGHIMNFDWWLPYIPNLKVKTFMFYIGINDFYKEDDYYFDRLRPEISNAHLFIKSRSALYNLFRVLRGMYLAKYKYDLAHPQEYKEIEHWTDQPSMTSHREIMAPYLNGYEKRLRTLDQKVKERGAEAILVTQSTRRCQFKNGKLFGVDAQEDYFDHKINGADYCIMLNILNEKTVQVGKELGVKVFDLANELDLGYTDFYDNVHTTKKGSKKIGDYLYIKLEK